MKNLQKMINILKEQEQLHKNDVFNYAIPQSWNIYGYQAMRRLRDGQLLVNPYAFYSFTIEQIFKDGIPAEHIQEENRDWLKRSVIYSMMIRTATAWDHDRDNIIHHDNLYHLSDNGTFLKCVALLPLLKRMGVNTILLYQPFALGKTQKAHDFAPREAVLDFTQLDDDLRDPMLEEMDVLQQAQAFMEACHILGFKVILEYCPAMMARENAYAIEHPEWFYWIKEEYEGSYHAPDVHTLPQNTIPYPYTQKDLYRSEDVKEHIAQFVHAPENMERVSLAELRKKQHICIAPAIVDQINANIPADPDTTILRFYEDLTFLEGTESYMLQDTIRPDLYTGKQPITACWKQLNKNIRWYQKNLNIDGLYIAKPYLLPKKLQKDLTKTARRQRPDFVMIAEDTTVENSSEWLHLGYDMISGNSGYEEADVWDFKFHNFAYRLKGNECGMFTASEFCDSRRIGSLTHGKTLAVLLTIMNHFLPNGVPMLLNGIESFDPQPTQLSVYGDTSTLRTLPKEDSRYLRQPFLDQYAYDYVAYDLSLLINLLEKTSKIRNEYLDAICDAQRSIPVWFDSPKAMGIGFTFLKEETALMVVCNVNVAQMQTLHIHTDNLMPNLAFKCNRIQQIFSTKEPYRQGIETDDLHNLTLDFEPGEVKFIEFQ